MSSAAQNSTTTGRWYVVVIVCSFGLLAWLPFVHAGRQLGRPAVTSLAWRYAAAAVVMVVDDVFAFTDIPVAAWDVIRDRAVVIPRLS